MIVRKVTAFFMFYDMLPC